MADGTFITLTFRDNNSDRMMTVTASEATDDQVMQLVLLLDSFVVADSEAKTGE